ncbi:MAG: integrase family protein [Aquirhabdus sp.]
MKWENFIAGRVDAFKCAEGKTQSIFWDGKTSGLGLRVTAAGAKSYIFETSLKKKTIRITIGNVSTYSIDTAQKIAIEYRAQTDRGIDPRQVAIDKLDAEQAARTTKEFARVAQSKQEAIEQDRQTLIARTAWDVYLAAPHPKWGNQYRADHDSIASAGGVLSKIGNKMTKPAPLASLLYKPLHEITAPVVLEWLANECISRPTSAHNGFRKFRTFIKWCAKHLEYKHVVHLECCITSEVKDIVPASKTKEGDCLQREQLPDWFAAVNKIESHVVRAYLQALLITGARRRELAMVKWEDIDFKWNSMTIRDKVEGLRTIPLTPYVSHLLAALPRRSEWVFSSPTAASGYITDPRIAHTKALQNAGLPHVSLYGLRRSFDTLSEWVEVPTGVVAQIQGHKLSALAEKHYRRRPLQAGFSTPKN